MATKEHAQPTGLGVQKLAKKLYADPNVGFAWLRILCAIPVVAEHSFYLVNPNQPVNFLNEELGYFSLMVFFALSGYQIQDSWERDPSWWRFSARRILRIVPPLAVVLLLTVFVLGPIFTTLPLGSYFSNPNTWGYLTMVVPNLLKGPLPGVFEHNPHVYSINPSLWTLPMEVIAYGIVLVVGIAVAIGVSRWIVPVLLLAMMIWQGYDNATLGPFDSGGMLGVIPLGQFVTLLVPFLAGVAIHRFRHQISFRPRYAAALLAGWIVIHMLFGSTPAPSAAPMPGTSVWEFTLDGWLWAFAMAYGAITLGRHWPKRLEKYGPWVYGSYGAYIYGAPIQQTLVYLGIMNGWVIFAIAAPLAYAFGLASWHLVEWPTQKLRRHLRAKELPGTPAAKKKEPVLATTG